MSEQQSTPEAILDKYIYQTQFFRKPSLFQFLCTYKNIVLIAIVCYVFFKTNFYVQFIVIVSAVFYIFRKFRDSFFTFTLKISKEEKTVFNIWANLIKKFYTTRHDTLKKEAILAEELLYKQKKIKTKKGKKK